MSIDHKGRKVLLRAASKEDLPELVKHFSSMKIHMFTQGMFAQTIENELEWYEKKRNSQDDCVWLIQPDGYDKPVGITALHNLVNKENTCTSGIIIWDPNWWGKGVASAAHIGRTYFAANYLNRFTIRSCVRTANVASNKALENVGYTVWGVEPIDDFRDGAWLWTNHLIWIRPNMTSWFFPEGVPEMYLSGIERATQVLKTAKSEVTFL